MRVNVAAMPWTELGRYSRNEAHIIVGRLASEGIEAIAFDGEASIGDGSWLAIPVRVMVDEADLADAREAVRPVPDWPAAGDD